MKLIIDIGHPAHVHLFRSFAKEMMQNGHQILFTAREKENAIDLLKAYELPYQKLGRNKNSIPGKITGFIGYEIRLLIASLRFKPDAFLSHGSFYAALVSFFINKKHISLEDTANMEQVRLYLPFTYLVLSPDCLTKRFSKKQFFYNGYHELAYLHPDLFQPSGCPSDEITRNNERIILFRFVSRKASHDVGYHEMTSEDKVFLIEKLKKYGKVLISSEEELAPPLNKFRLEIAAEKFHEIISRSSVVIGNSATVASEAAMIGVPAFYIDNIGRSYTTELEKKYGLVFNYPETKSGIDQCLNDATRVLEDEKSKNIWIEKQKRMIKDKINLTNLLVLLFDDFPVNFAKLKSGLKNDHLPVIYKIE